MEGLSSSTVCKVTSRFACRVVNVRVCLQVKDGKLVNSCIFSVRSCLTNVSLRLIVTCIHGQHYIACLVICV